MAERNAKGQFVKGAGGSKKGARKGKGKKGARKGKKGTRGGALGARVARLEEGQRVLVTAVQQLDARVDAHEAAIARIGSVIGERFAKPRKSRGKKG